jgi:signal transduction histidine kinase
MMSKVKLIINGLDHIQEISLSPKGATVGRSDNCDVILDHESVSRQHARISQDPFGRWIIEDLESSNGVLVDGERVKVHVIFPGQQFNISHFTLSVLEESDPRTVTAIQSTIPIVDKGPAENIVAYRTEPAAVLPPALMQHLNEFTSGLLKLSSPAQLYWETCFRLAEMFDTLVAIVRLPCDGDSTSESPAILACHFRGQAIDTAEVFDLHLSRRVLDAVRSTDVPVMASSGLSGEESMKLTIVDEQKPHVVFAARVNDLGEMVDALYVDILEEKSPGGMFDYVEAVARQINLVQKHLFFTELEKQEKALRQANDQLKEKDRIKDEYVSRVTHDIKGHLAAIQSCLYVASSTPPEAPDDKHNNFLDRARNRTTQLSGFVNELLNLTRMRLSGKLETSAFLLAETISRALKTVERKADDKSIALSSNVEASVGEIIANEFSINEVLTNLLFNAIKYTGQGKTVHLDAKGFDDHVQIDICDTGMGIPAGEIANIFDEFFRASNARKNEKDGTGLGLSIVKQIIERHGGEISAQSQEGQGTTFTVILPKNGHG